MGDLNMAEGLKGVAMTLACVSILLMVYATQLPQYGDGAIGTVMVFTAALVAYAVTLLVAVPLVIHSVAHRETLTEARYPCFAIVAPVIVGALVVVWSAALS